MKLRVDENGKLMKWQVDEIKVEEIAIWWDYKLMKWQVDEMASWWNDKLMKCQVDEMSSWWNVKLMQQRGTTWQTYFCLIINLFFQNFGT
jgi:hypothetical protein